MINEVFLIGNLGADPELKQLGSGAELCTFRLATNAKWKDRDGELQEKTTWHSVVVWDKGARACGQYLHKGSKVLVRGSIENSSWEDDDGNKRYKSEIKAHRHQGVVFLDSKGSSPARSEPTGGYSDDIGF